MTLNELTTTERAVCAALERLADENSRMAEAARTAGEKTDAKFFQRAANAYAKALQHYLSGLRPLPTPNGWMLPSQRPGEPPHLLTLSGDWRCTCPAGDSMHWASALVIGYEVATDDLGRFDDPPTEEPEEESGSDTDGIQYDNIPYPDGIGNPDAASDLCECDPWRDITLAEPFIPSAGPVFANKPDPSLTERIAAARRRYLEAA